MQLETKIRQDIEKYLRQNRIWFVRVQANANTVGVPDIIACYKGRLIALEVKTPKGSPSELQLQVMKAIRDNGGIGGFPTSVQEVVEILKQAE